MTAILNNVWQNVYFAWEYGNPSSQEPEDWKEKTVEILPLKSESYKNSRSICACFWSVALRITEMTTNTWTYFRSDNHQLAEKVLNLGGGNYRSIAYFPTFLGNFFFVTDPNVMKSVLKHPRNEVGERACFSGGIPTQISKKILGDNLLSYSDEQQKRFRESIVPFLKFQPSFKSSFLDLTQKKLEELAIGRPFRLYPLLPSLVVEAVCSCYLRYFEHATEIADAVERVLSLVSSSESRAYKEALIVLHQHSTKAMQPLRGENHVLDNISDDELQTFVRLMFFAGQDTTSVFIEYLIFILGQKNSGERWQEGIFEQWKQSDEDIVDFAQHCPLLDSIVQEALRMHPPSFEQTREVVQHLVIDHRYFIPAKTEIHMNHFFSQRDVRRWGKEPTKFIPERFNSNVTKSVLYPFSLGPTTCLGKNFAILLSKIFVMRLIVNFKWQSVTELESLNGAIALKLKPDLHILLKEREKNSFCKN